MNVRSKSRTIAPRRSRSARSRSPGTARLSFLAHEYIRVVPLHHPEPAVPTATSGRRAKAITDPFDGRLRIAPANVDLTYRGGPLIRNVQVFTVFWGAKWNTSASARKLTAKLNSFFTAILPSALLDQLAEYSVPGKSIGHGTLIGSATLAAAAPTGGVADSMIQTQLAAWIKAGTLPATTANTLYFVFLEPGVASIMGGSRSCQSYCGYHSNSGNVYYAVMPYPGCAGCLGGRKILDALTGTSSHELCEAITDPVPGSGWYDDVNGEIGDICAWNFKQVAGYNVQLEWSNKLGRCA